jgi:uncharacterized protein (DUF433 family)
MAQSIPADPIPLRWSDDRVLLVGRTRVPLETVIESFKEGATAEEIAIRYDALDLADVYSVIGYYLRHRQEVEDYLAGAQQEREAIRQQIEAQFPSIGIRERLTARRAAMRAGREAPEESAASNG